MPVYLVADIDVHDPETYDQYSQAAQPTFVGYGQVKYLVRGGEVTPLEGGMEAEAASHPTIETEFGRFPALQIVTLANLFLGQKPKLPPLISPVKKASRVETRASHQKGAQGALL